MMTEIPLIQLPKDTLITLSTEFPEGMLQTPDGNSANIGIGIYHVQDGPLEYGRALYHILHLGYTAVAAKNPGDIVNSTTMPELPRGQPLITLTNNVTLTRESLPNKTPDGKPANIKVNIYRTPQGEYLKPGKELYHVMPVRVVGLNVDDLEDLANVTEQIKQGRSTLLERL